VQAAQCIQGTCEFNRPTKSARLLATALAVASVRQNVKSRTLYAGSGCDIILAPRAPGCHWLKRDGATIKIDWYTTNDKR
jgi:hypothetical protein